MGKFVYPMVVYSDFEDGKIVWRGNFPGLHGCWLDGASKDEVLRLAPSVLGEYASAAVEAGMILPEPPSERELAEADAGEVVVVRAELPQ